MSQLLQCIQQDTLTDDALIGIASGGTSHVLHSLTMCYGVFASQEPSFASITKAAHMGGDTDSNASIVGSMVGAVIGTCDYIPKEYLVKLQKKDRIEQVAREFYASL